VASALACGLSLGVLALLPTAQSAVRDGVTGQARVIDGDTLEISGTHVRLEGIDAPESAQTCSRRFVGTWACGKVAARELASLTEGREIACERSGTDKYGRMLGVCFVDGHDINAEMVRKGLAWAFVRYSSAYVSEEAQARAAKVGVWQGKSEPAWDFRANRWASAESAAPNGCAIKGNISSNGRIYHMPWSPWYGKVHIETSKGERWFCSEQQAVAAGWRPVAVH
jgi:endonuclease YncB( thermonuclease family)